ncbi:hypothetical protein PR202_gb05755 [Eleusine coracana subsp. coracana]|uniref:6-phosphogluconate dehydrogenase NADP-binding domain-containing protein n=1 Tax=Eleusine coracana subsp. coracana TaxID=191504 RepID=A0AAV5E5E5_ELECO|nr:hypothetical protein PR202_gb05755 [Eleusine coracana subsp. coracana]
MAAAAFLCSRAATAAALIPRRALSRCFSVSCSAASAASSSGQGAGGVEFTGKVGFLGLGIMGTPMASNLIKAGCDVTVWNRTKSKCDPLLTLGAKYQPSPAEVASSCDVTFAMLADPESAVEVACGTNGAAEGLAPGKGRLQFQARKSRQKMGCSSFLLQSRFYLGDVGNGAAMKLVVNMVMGRRFVRRIQETEIEEALKRMKSGKAMGPDSIPIEDLRLALTLAESVSQSIPTVAAANEVYKVAKSLGLADEDFSAVIEALKAKAQGSKQYFVC